MPAQQSEPSKLWGSGGTKAEGQQSADRARGHQPQGYKEQGHRGDGTRWRPRLCSRSWVRPARALPLLLLQRHVQEGARFPALWPEPPQMAGEEWGALGGGGLVLLPQESFIWQQIVS